MQEEYQYELSEEEKNWFDENLPNEIVRERAKFIFQTNNWRDIQKKIEKCLIGSIYYYDFDLTN